MTVQPKSSEIIYALDRLARALVITRHALTYVEANTTCDYDWQQDQLRVGRIASEAMAAMADALTARPCR